MRFRWKQLVLSLTFLGGCVSLPKRQVALPLKVQVRLNYVSADEWQAEYQLDKPACDEC